MVLNDLDDCLKAGLLKKYSHTNDEIQAELRQAEDDLASARDSLRSGDNKWATIQAYYSMFHAAKAVLFSAGYRERSHYCILLFLDKLVNEGRLETNFANDFRSAMFLRKEADYNATFSEQSALDTADNAMAFIKKMKSLL